jgi:hypothetical protein
MSARKLPEPSRLTHSACCIRFETRDFYQAKFEEFATANTVSLRDALHVAVECHENGVINVRNDTYQVIRRAPCHRLVEKGHLMPGFHESVANRIGYAFVKK